MSFTTSKTQLTHQGAMALLTAAIKEADRIGQPQCIVVVDASGELIAEVRMTGAKFLSRKSAFAKAQTAASIGAPSANIPDDFRPGIAAATGGAVTGLPGGLPIRIGDELLGGIGVGTGTGEQDVIVGNAALKAIGADTFPQA
ncbi:MAG: heme-binding protein [Hyphomicrobiales bacterium]